MPTFHFEPKARLMKKLYTLLLGVFLQINAHAQVNGGLYGTLWTGPNQYFSYLNLNSGTITNLANLPGVTAIADVENLIDAANSQYIFRTNLGTTVISIPSGSIVNTLPNTTNFMRYSLRPDGVSLGGITWNNPTMVYRSLDLNSGAFTTLSTLAGVNSSVNLESTTDPVNNYHIINTNLGITVINAVTGALVKTIPNTLDLRNFEYNPATGKIYGCYKSGSYFYFGSLDLVTETFAQISLLPGVTTTFNLENTMDLGDNYYINQTNLGVTVINAQNGAILKTLPVPSGFRGFEFSNLSSINGIGNPVMGEQTLLYPNPTTDNVTLQLTPAELGKAYCLVDELGRKIKSGKLADQNSVIEISELPTGIYFLQVLADKPSVYKIIKL